MFTRVADLVDHLLALELVLVVQALPGGADVQVDAAVGVAAHLHLAQEVGGEVLDLLFGAGPGQGVFDEPGVAVREAGRGVVGDTPRRAAQAGRLRPVDGHAAPEPGADALGLDVSSELATQPGEQGLGLRARQALELDDLVHQVLEVLDDVAHGGSGVAQADHRQLADGGADEVGGGALDAGDDGGGVEHAGEVVDQALAER